MRKDLLKKMVRKIFLPAKKWRILAPFLVMGVFVGLWAWWASPESGEPYMGALPDGYWLCFKADQRGDGFNALEDGRVTDYQVPGSIEYCTPDRFRQVLNGRRAMPIDGPGEDYPDKVHGFQVSFLEENGRPWTAAFWENGLILIRNDTRSHWYRDGGGSYSALRRHFGTREDLVNWRAIHH